MIRRFILLIIPYLLFQFNSAHGLELRIYHVRCDADELQYIINRSWEDNYIDCSFEFNGDVWEDVRIRIRGESGRAYPKKSFKLNFNRNNRFQNRDKVNLVSEWTDHSFAREFLSYDMFRRAGLPASNAGYVQLFINDDNFGLYLDVEQVDEHLLSGYDEIDNQASIYKADDEGCMLKPTDSLGGVWDKKTNIETGYYDLRELIDWLHYTPAERFFDEFERRFDAVKMARVIAVHSLIGNLSTYYHNYYMIHEIGQDGKWYMFPWDMDKTFRFAARGLQPDYYNCGDPIRGTNALYWRCWNDGQMRELIMEQFRDIIERVFVADYFEAMIDTIGTILADAVEADPFIEHSVEEFLEELGEIPDQIGQRGENLLNLFANGPTPFALNEAVPTPNGMYLSWNDATTPRDGEVTYSIYIGTDSLFIPDTYVRIDEYEDTSMVYDQMEGGIRHYYRVRAYGPNGTWLRSFQWFSAFNTPRNGFDDGTIVTGTIEESTTWTLEGSPYTVPETITIASEAVLTVEAGVLVGIGPWQKIIVEGGLSIEGAVRDSVTFTRLNPNHKWRMIEALGPTDDINIDFAVFQGAYEILDASHCTVNISNSHLANGRWGVKGTDVTMRINSVVMDHFETEMIFTYEGGEVFIRNSKFSNASFVVESSDILDFFQTDYVEITGCEFYCGWDDGIDMDWVHSGVISGNKIYDAGDTGITITSGFSDIYIANNIITGCSTAVSLANVEGVILYNNVLAFSKLGLDVLHDEAPDAPPRIFNSVLWRNDSNVRIIHEGSIDVNYCLIQADTLYPGEGNQRSNANFVDQWSHNFHLRGDSPLIDAGYGTNHPEFDINSGGRVDNPEVENTGSGELSYVDIGAYEYGSPGYIEPPVRIPERHDLIQVYPNPFNSSARITFQLLSGNWAKIFIYDLNGRLVHNRQLANLAIGVHTTELDSRNPLTNLSSGLYFVTVSQENITSVEKILLLK